MGLEGFECKAMAPPVFKEMLRRTFGLKLTPREAGAIIKHLNNNTNNDINCSEFTTLFCQLGITERSKVFSESLIKQAEENKIRQENDEKKVKERVERFLKIESDYSQLDIDNATQKLIKAAAGIYNNILVKMSFYIHFFHIFIYIRIRSLSSCFTKFRSI
jgi:hypothetical protein